MVVVVGGALRERGGASVDIRVLFLQGNARVGKGGGGGLTANCVH